MGDSVPAAQAAPNYGFFPRSLEWLCACRGRRLCYHPTRSVKEAIWNHNDLPILQDSKHVPGTSMKDTLGVLLAGGAGERLYPLTRDRAKPAVTFGGIYRIIDITLSNCINSDLRRVYILTQYKALSLNRHIREGWGTVVGHELGEFIEILPPMKRVSDNWYMGTADAVYQNIYSIGSEEPKYVLILSGDHIYKMNYDLMLRQHKDSGADITLATILVEPSETRHFGVVEIDRTGR